MFLHALIFLQLSFLRQLYLSYVIFIFIIMYIYTEAIPTLPMMEEGALDTYDFDPDAPAGSSFLDHDVDTNHPATHIAFTASAIDGALAEFEFLSPLAEDIHPNPVSVLAPAAVAPILPAQAEAVASTTAANTSTKKRASTSDAASKKTAKKRKVSKPKAVKANGNKKSSKASETVPALVSPNSSQSLSSVDDKRPVALMPSLPSSSSAFKKQPLLPKPTSVVSGSVTPSSRSNNSSANNSVAGDDSAPNSPSNSKSMLVINFTDPVNISSEHIQMLTSEQGPAECAKAIITPPSGLDGRQRGNKQSMSHEERAKASRDRNREHARNTRLRKKAYVEELKRTLTALADQRDHHLAQQQDKAQQEAEQRNVRYRVLEEFMTLRGRGNHVNEDAHRWGAILVPGFTLRLPTLQKDNQSNQWIVQDKTLMGVDQVMLDASAFAHVLQQTSHASLQYQTDRNSFMMDGNLAVLEWTATSVAKEDLSFNGNIKAQFDPASNQLVSVTLLFDSSCLTSGM